MKHFILIAACAVAPLAAHSEGSNPVIDDVLNNHVLPRFEDLAERSDTLAEAAQMDCSAESEQLRAAYGAAFDAWIAASHLRFGPTETDDRGFALAFWPDGRGATPKALRTLISDQDPIALAPEDYAEMPVSARGFYALEFLLYDDALRATGDPDYRCTLIRTVAADIAATSQAILNDWQPAYVQVFQDTGPDSRYRTEQEAVQELFKALTTGLQFTSESRLGRPLGSFERPRPKRAEARRSGRSARHVMLSLVSLRDLAERLAAADARLAEPVAQGFDRAIQNINDLDDPVFAGVAAPQDRFKVEVVRQSVENIRRVVLNQMGPILGVAAGFNSLDGD